MFEQECIPFAPSLIESMRSLGYSFPSAIADLIDNSISAKAKKIDIISEPGSNPSLIILDDGMGMSVDKLYEAMRYGSTNPLENRSEDDLGRFGLGLKSASLSQCRRMIVVSKQKNIVNSYSWDLDYVIEKGQWMLKGFTLEEIEELPNINLLQEQESGTYIYLSEFDRIKEGTSNISETFNKCLNDMIEHLSLVFHRFIEEGLNIAVNNLSIEASDPFLLSNKATQRKKESYIYIKENKITLKPYILPHISKLSQEDLVRAGGKENLRSEQGFYVYRNKRLIIWGTWFRLERKDELNKLARVRVDIPNSLDYMWSIDIKKSTATLPDILKKNMYNAVYESVLSSESVHTFRGRKEKKDKDIEYIWERVKVREGYRYSINRHIPQLKMLEETLDDKQVKIFDDVIKLLEESFPVSALYVDAAKGNLDQEKKDEEDMDNIWADLQIQMEYVKRNNLSVKCYYEAFMKIEPYCNYKEIKQRIQEEINKNE
ncbi:ATP-binding protein [Anaerorhabdus sp.]|uniref:ATP-binding protein n=1 Tax=Anaerorhabdus sp. TaxID=1872524 RepID=UPI002FC791CE